jgi:hypothetical protein
MLSYQESVQRFKELKLQLNIPPDAEFFSVEKRHIEQMPTGEIEAMDGAPAAPAPEAHGADGEPGITERLAWVAEFTRDFMFWELAIDAQGKLVRLRKSR